MQILMNAFYERLYRFGALLSKASEQSGENIVDVVTVIHPGYPVVSHTRSTTPKLVFKQECPIYLRRKIRKIMRSAFRPAESGQA